VGNTSRGSAAADSRNPAGVARGRHPALHEQSLVRRGSQGSHGEELRKDYPALTTKRAAAILDRVLENADWFETVPHLFSFSSHTKDDHLFDLVIESNARYLVTFENRILALQDGKTADAKRFRELAPGLRIVNPPALARELKARRAKE